MQQTQFGAYFIQAKLGEGSDGIVYKAFHQRRGIWVALKILHPTLAPDDAEFFQAVGQRVSQLDHPHIVNIEEVGDVNGQTYVAMEYLENGTLDDLLRNFPNLNLATCARLINQLASGLDYAHEQGIIHGKLTPNNILLERPEHVVISDFAHRGNEAEDRRALAEIAYRLAVGRFPAVSPARPSKVNSRLPSQVDAVLLGGLEGAYSSAGNFAAAFQQVTENYKAPAVIPKPKQSSQRMTAAGVVLIGLAILIAVLALILSGGQDEIEPEKNNVVISLQPTPTLTLTPSLTRTPTITPSPTITLSPTITDTPTLAQTDTPVPLEIQIGGNERVNIRSGPGTNYGIVARALPDDQFLAVGFAEQDEIWYLVELTEGGLGWISGSVVELPDGRTVEELPVADYVSPTPANTRVPQSQNNNPAPPENTGPRLVQSVQLNLTGGWQNTGIVLQPGDTLRITGAQGLVSGRVGGTNLAIGDSFEATLGGGGLLELQASSAITVQISVFR